MAWTQYQNAAGGKKASKQGTSPLYSLPTYSGTGTYSNQAGKDKQATATAPTAVASATPTTITAAPSSPNANVIDTGLGYSAVVTPYGAMPLTGGYAASANTVREQTGQQLPFAGALTPDQLMTIGGQILSADAAAAAAAARLPQALRTADRDYFGNLRSARQAGTAATQDWRSILAGAGMGRSPALGLMQLERVRGGLTGREIELAAAREAAKANARQEARDAQAAAATTRANLAQQVAAYETGNINKYLEQLLGGYLPTNGS